jgi:hypothetical protein
MGSLPFRALLGSLILGAHFSTHLWRGTVQQMNVVGNRDSNHKDMNPNLTIMFAAKSVLKEPGVEEPVLFRSYFVTLVPWDCVTNEVVVCLGLYAIA